MSRIIVITGGGSGLGRAMARRLAADGHRLVLLGRTFDKVRSVAEEIGENASALECDVAESAAVDSAFSEISKRFGAIDVLMNNAGFYRPSLLRDAGDALINEAFSINLVGPIYCTRAALPHLRRGAHIINISSETVVVPVAMLGLYQAAKAGLERFTNTLRQEVEADGIRVTLIRAGKMYDADTKLSGDPDVLRQFAEENAKLGGTSSRPAISRFQSVAELIPTLITLPLDLNIREMMLEAREP